MLVWRLAMSALLIPAFAGLFWADNRAGATAPILFAVCLLLALRCVWELVLLLRVRFGEIEFLPCASCVAGIAAAAWLPHWMGAPVRDFSVLGPACLTYVVCSLGLLAYEASRYECPGQRMESLGGHLLVVSYVGMLLAATVQLRWVAGADLGYLALGSMVIAVKMGDTGAYTFGRLFGRTKMSPKLSPGKTWAGFVGALVGSGAGAWAWLQFATPLFDAAARPPAWYWSLFYGVVMGIVGLVGDLCESLIKRDMGQKDAAALMPGFGGLLDLLDSILYAGPVAYVLWLVLPLSSGLR